jgi:AraC family cel operon transcriptional repressor
MTIHYYLADTMVNAAMGGQYSMLDNHSATCSYPQVHDFHEIALTVKGHQVVTMGDRTVTLKSGELLWVRPGEVHSKSGFKECTQINVSFTQETVDSLISYFDDEVVTQLLTSSELMPILPLSASQQTEIRQRLDKLNFLSTRDLSLARMQMRILLSQVLGLYAQYAREFTGTNQEESTPMWFTQLLWELESPERLHSSLDDLSEMAQRSKAYISRSFRRYLDMTPTQYMNKLRLEYAENLLSHSDKAILDIAMESGFENLSHFYHQFQKKNGASPMVYRRNTIVFLT